MYKHILVAVDGSPISKRALKEAIKLAQTLQAELRIVHVIDEFAFSWDTEFAQMEATLVYIHEAGKRILEAATKEARDMNIKVESKLLEIETPDMRVGELIAQEAANVNADLIVLGTHGRRGFSRLLLGSVAETVVRVAIPPVLLVRE